MLVAPAVVVMLICEVEPLGFLFGRCGSTASANSPKDPSNTIEKTNAAAGSRSTCLEFTGRFFTPKFASN